MIPFSSVEMVENMTKDFSRYVFDVGIAYREDVDEVIDALRDLGDEMRKMSITGRLSTNRRDHGTRPVCRSCRSSVPTTKPIKQWEVGRELIAA